MQNPAATEVDAYVFIKRKLAELGWKSRNPAQQLDGRARPCFAIHKTTAGKGFTKATFVRIGVEKMSGESREYKTQLGEGEPNEAQRLTMEHVEERIKQLERELA